MYGLWIEQNSPNFVFHKSVKKNMPKCLAENLLTENPWCAFYQTSNKCHWLIICCCNLIVIQSAYTGLSKLRLDFQSLKNYQVDVRMSFASDSGYNSDRVMLVCACKRCNQSLFFADNTLSIESGQWRRVYIDFVFMVLNILGWWIFKYN